MHIVITGGSGFIGRHLTKALLSEGNRVTILTRSKQHIDLPQGAQSAVWPGNTGETNDGKWQEVLADACGVVNLAGESIGAKRWSTAQKERIKGSRVETTKVLIEALASLQRRPQTLISGSAVGYYGPCGDEAVTESTKAGNDFLSIVCKDWENEAQKAEKLQVRVVQLRTGLVLDAHEGALPRMLMPFKFMVGGPLGSGKQWMPWIHIDDLVNLIIFALNNEAVKGALNAVSPNPITNAYMSKIIGKILNKPSLIPAPGFMLRLGLGEMADSLLLSGQKAIPAKALALGYHFYYLEAEQALKDVLTR